MVHLNKEELISCVGAHDTVMNILANIDLDRPRHYEYVDYHGHRVVHQGGYELATLLALGNLKIKDLI